MLESDFTGLLRAWWGDLKDHLFDLIGSGFEGRPAEAVRRRDVLVEVIFTEGVDDLHGGEVFKVGDMVEGFNTCLTGRGLIGESPHLDEVCFEVVDGVLCGNDLRPQTSSGIYPILKRNGAITDNLNKVVHFMLRPITRC